MLSCENRILVTVKYAVVKIRFLVFPCKQFFLLFFFYLISLMQHNPFSSIFLDASQYLETHAPVVIRTFPRLHDRPV